MRTLHPALTLLLLAACSRPPADQGGTAIKDTVPSTDQLVDVPIPGYYEDTLPCADCPGLVTQLWVRSDSTFILRQHYIDRDTLPFGTIGQWHVVNGLVTVGMTGDKPDFYRPTAEGLMLVDELGEALGLGVAGAVVGVTSGLGLAGSCVGSCVGSEVEEGLAVGVGW